MAEQYLAFLGLAVVVALTPGADLAFVTRNALVGGRRQGLAAALGVAGAARSRGSLRWRA